MTDWKTYISKSKDGWKAVSAAPFMDGMHMRVITRKSSGGVIMSSVSVSKMDGDFIVHRIHRDYHKVIDWYGYRCTEGNIRKVHGESMDDIGRYISEAMAHYRDVPDWVNGNEP